MPHENSRVILACWWYREVPLYRRIFSLELWKYEYHFQTFCRIRWPFQDKSSKNIEKITQPILPPNLPISSQQTTQTKCLTKVSMLISLTVWHINQRQNRTWAFFSIVIIEEQNLGLIKFLIFGGRAGSPSFVPPMPMLSSWGNYVQTPYHLSSPRGRGILSKFFKQGLLFLRVSC